jgi:hypothetical protein
MEIKRTEYLEKALDVLKERLSMNVEQVKKNSLITKEMINQDPFSEFIRDIRIENKRILTENKDILQLQLLIHDYINKYDQFYAPRSKEILKERSVSEWFMLTINNVVELNKEHPMVHDQEFLNDLLQFYLSKEAFEKCRFIQGLLKEC